MSLHMVMVLKSVMKPRGKVMVKEVVMKKRGMVMVMEDSELREQVESNINYVVSNYDPQCTDPIIAKRRSKDAKDAIMSLLDKCNDLNIISQKWSKPFKSSIAEDAQDRLKQTIDNTMERLETWLPKNWAGLVKELRYEINVAYDKFINLKKKYYEWIETSQRNQGSELVKAYIARDIQDYVKYGINISILNGVVPTRWVRKIAIHFELLVRELKGLNVRNETNLRRFAEEVSLYKQCMLNFGDYAETGLNESNSQEYLMLRQKGGIPFSDLVERKKNELGIEVKFTHLRSRQQLEVYQAIINEFGGENLSNVQFVDFIFGDGTHES